MKHKTSDLEGALLDAAVAKAEDLVPIPHQPAGYFYWKTDLGGAASGWWTPSRDWEQGGPIIERERILLAYSSEQDDAEAGMRPEWNALVGGEIEGDQDTGGDRIAAYGNRNWGFGPTPLIAAMRAYVASKFGEEVDLP